MTDRPRDEWVIVRRFSDPIAAEMTADFLRDHEITVAMRGSTGMTSVMNGYGIVPDIRIVVPAAQVEAAKRALVAMAEGTVLADDRSNPFSDPDLEDEPVADTYRTLRRDDRRALAIGASRRRAELILFALVAVALAAVVATLRG